MFIERICSFFIRFLVYFLLGLWMRFCVKVLLICMDGIFVIGVEWF